MTKNIHNDQGHLSQTGVSVPEKKTMNNTQQPAVQALGAVNGSACQATPHKELIRQIMDSRILKNEREWAAAREIEDLRRKLRDRKRHLRAANKGAEIASLTAQLCAARNVKLAEELYELRKQNTKDRAPEDHEASMPAWRRTPNAEGWWIAWDGKYPSLHFVSHLKHRHGLHVYLRSTWRHVATLGNDFECWQPITVPSYFDGLNAKDQAPAERRLPASDCSTRLGHEETLTD